MIITQPVSFTITTLQLKELINLGHDTDSTTYMKFGPYNNMYLINECSKCGLQFNKEGNYFTINGAFENITCDEFLMKNALE